MNIVVATFKVSKPKEVNIANLLKFKSYFNILY